MSKNLFRNFILGLTFSALALPALAGKKLKGPTYHDTDVEQERAIDEESPCNRNGNCFEGHSRNLYTCNNGTVLLEIDDYTLNLLLSKEEKKISETDRSKVQLSQYVHDLSGGKCTRTTINYDAAELLCDKPVSDTSGARPPTLYECGFNKIHNKNYVGPYLPDGRFKHVTFIGETSGLQSGIWPFNKKYGSDIDACTGRTYADKLENCIKGQLSLPQFNDSHFLMRPTGPNGGTYYPSADKAYDAGMTDGLYAAMHDLPGLTAPHANNGGNQPPLQATSCSENWNQPTPDDDDCTEIMNGDPITGRFFVPGRKGEQCSNLKKCKYAVLYRTCNGNNDDACDGYSARACLATYDRFCQDGNAGCDQKGGTSTGLSAPPLDTTQNVRLALDALNALSNEASNDHFFSCALYQVLVTGEDPDHKDKAHDHIDNVGAANPCEGTTTFNYLSTLFTNFLNNTSKSYGDSSQLTRQDDFNNLQVAINKFAGTSETHPKDVIKALGQDPGDQDLVSSYTKLANALYTLSQKDHFFDYIKNGKGPINYLNDYGNQSGSLVFTYDKVVEREGGWGAFPCLFNYQLRCNNDKEAYRKQIIHDRALARFLINFEEENCNKPAEPNLHKVNATATTKAKTPPAAPGSAAAPGDEDDVAPRAHTRSTTKTIQ